MREEEYLNWRDDAEGYYISLIELLFHTCLIWKASDGQLRVDSVEVGALDIID